MKPSFKTEYLDGTYYLKTHAVVTGPADSNCSKVVKPSETVNAQLSAAEAKALFKKDKYGQRLYSKLGFCSMFHESAGMGA